MAGSPTSISIPLPPINTISMFTALVGVKWISSLSCEFPRLVTKASSRLDFLCVKHPFFYYRVSFLTVDIFYIFWILIFSSYMCYKQITILILG